MVKKSKSLSKNEQVGGKQAGDNLMMPYDQTPEKSEIYMTT